jgi:hypothetical protein
MFGLYCQLVSIALQPGRYFSITRKYRLQVPIADRC